MVPLVYLIYLLNIYVKRKWMFFGFTCPLSSLEAFRNSFLRKYQTFLLSQWDFLEKWSCPPVITGFMSLGSVAQTRRSFLKNQLLSNQYWTSSMSRFRELKDRLWYGIWCKRRWSHSRRVEIPLTREQQEAFWKGTWESFVDYFMRMKKYYLVGGLVFAVSVSLFIRR